MKSILRNLWVFLFIWQGFSFVKAQSISIGNEICQIEEFYDKHIPLLVINTINKEEPDCDYVFAPEGLLGKSITNNHFVNGHLRISVNGLDLYDSGEYVDKESGIRIKIRGNSSAHTIKKPYKIKLQKAEDLLFRNNSAYYKDKDWLLISSGGVSTKAILGLWVNEAFGLQWTPQCRYVNLIINDVYRGLFLLVEAIERENCKLQVDKESGIILEHDAYWWNEDTYIETKHSKHHNYTFKYPDEKDITDERFISIKSAIDEMEASIDNGTYPSYIDLESFALWLLAHDLLGSFDSGGINKYITKYDDSPDSKFMMGNLWDFDCIEKNSNIWSKIHESQNSFYYPKLFNSNNKSFTKVYIKKWKELGEQVVDSVIKQCEEFTYSPLAMSINKFAAKDYKVSNWPWALIKYEMSSHKNFLTKRKIWMDEAITKLEAECTSIPATTHQSLQAEVYGINGKRIKENSKGIIICNGVKFLK